MAGLDTRVRKIIKSMISVGSIAVMCAACGSEDKRDYPDRGFRDTCNYDYECEFPYECVNGTCQYTGQETSAASAYYFEGDTAFFRTESGKAFACPLRGSTVDPDECSIRIPYKSDGARW
ncbi:MAG: hypothetical protein R6U32_03115 [Candidatus Woesearchaeota archaeon]